MNENKINVVWFCTDQQRHDTIHSLGNPYIKTPSLDRLINEGVAFKNAYTQSPVCTPSRSSFLTGKYPKATKAFYNGNDEYSQDELLVTKYFSLNGYECGLTGKLHLTSARGRMEKRCDDGYTYMKWSHHPHDDWDTGINHYQDWLKSQGVDWKKAYKGKFTSMDDFPPVENPEFTGTEIGIEAQFHQTTWCVSEAINFIEKKKEEGTPWLVSINPFDPHPPLDPPQEYKDKLKVEDMPLPLWREGEIESKPPHVQHDYIHGGQNGSTDSICGMSDFEKKEKVRDYYAQIELIDDQLGRLMDYLEESGQRDNTVIIYMSDHGETNGDHGLYWKGAYFYESITHVPLIISLPSKLKSNLVSNALVELVDIAPTICDLCNLPIPESMMGKSLVPILLGEANPDVHKDSVYCEFYSSLKNCHDDFYATMYFDGTYKIVVYHGKDFGELYNLVDDPNEFENLWTDPRYKDKKNELILKNFDASVIKTLDFSLHKLYTY